MQKPVFFCWVECVVIAFLMLLPCSLPAQTEVATDSLAFPVCKGEHKFHAKQLIAPAALITLGGVSVAFHDDLGKWGSGNHTKADDYIQYVPVAANLALGCLGVKHKHSLLDRAMISATAYVVEAALTNGLKYTVREARPAGSNNSFPSGHTATVFTGAELVRQEYGWGYGSAAYVVAIGTGFMRVYNNRHWLNDVVAGAGIGILSANVARWLYPLEKKWITPKSKRTDGAAMIVVPTYESQHQAVGVALTAVF